MSRSSIQAMIRVRIRFRSLFAFVGPDYVSECDVYEKDNDLYVKINRCHTSNFILLPGFYNGK
jgi:hypothetical protein